jgi:hypothetical protein
LQPRRWGLFEGTGGRVQFSVWVDYGCGHYDYAVLDLFEMSIEFFPSKSQRANKKANEVETGGEFKGDF